MKPKVFSSVRAAWKGFLSGEIAPNTRRVSCPDSLQDGVEREPPNEYTIAVCLPTIDESDKKVDISAMSEEDMRKLKQNDPFLYYSIPSKRFDYHSAAAVASRRSSMPAEVLARAEISLSRERQATTPRNRRQSDLSDSIVRRDRRLSTEAHPSLICDALITQMMLELGFDGDDDDVCDDLEILAADMGDDLELLTAELDL